MGRLRRLVLFVLLAAAHADTTPASVDFAAVPRRIAKAPRTVAAQPLYGLYLFGPDGGKRMWAVLDKSTPGALSHDVLYLDLDADGDLTEPGERIAAHRRDIRYEGGHASVFRIARLVDPATRAVHTRFELRARPREVECTLQWRGKTQVRALYRRNFGRSPEAAPVFHPGADRPLVFHRRNAHPLKRGESRHVYFALGNRGSSEDAFFCVANTLLPKDDALAASLHYLDRAGKWRRQSVKLRERC